MLLHALVLGRLGLVAFKDDHRIKTQDTLFRQPIFAVSHKKVKPLKFNVLTIHESHRANIPKALNIFFLKREITRPIVTDLAFFQLFSARTQIFSARIPDRNRTCI